MTRQGYGLGIGGCDKLCSATMGLSLVILFFLSVSIEDRPLLWMVVRSQIYYPLLSWVSALSGPTDWRRERWRSKYRTEGGSQV
jgi:hypothetical protein